WPDSLGGSAVEGDLHSMRPTDPRLNSTRNNNLYGYANGGKAAESNEANGYLNGGTYVSGVFEPNDYAKGDCARVVLYDYVVASSMSSVTEVFTDVNTLLEWCALDPVDEFEMSRNDVAQEIQGCRNPFVDYPELAWVLMGKTIPSDLTTPSGGATVSYTVTAVSNNTSYGTVSVSGNAITATPKTGYCVDGYTILAGSATVSRDGDVFTVTPTSNCTIRINFVKKSMVTVSFNGKADTITAYAGDAVTLPAGPEVDGYTFIGWVKETCTPTTACPSYYTGGKSYTVNASISLYPLYSYTEGDGGTGWSLVLDDDELYAGAQIILASNAKDRVAGDITSTYLTEVSVTFTQTDYLASVGEDAMIFTLGGSAGAWTLRGEAGLLLGASALKTMTWDSGETTWDISVESGVATISSTNDSYGRILHNSSAKRFTTYASNPTTSMVLPQIYMNGGGTVYYTTETTTCTHSKTTYTKATEATCTQTGSVAYYTCNSCGKYFADAGCTQALTAAQLILPAKGHTAGTYSYNAESHWKICSVCGADVTDAESHNWNEGTVTLQPTEEKDGILTYTCGTCGTSYTEAIPALGAKVYIHFSVPQGVEAVNSIYGYKGDTLILPGTSGVPGEGYTFVGWTLTDVKDVASAPTFYKAGAQVIISETVTLKALYRYAVGDGNGPGAWNLVTDVAQLTDGAQVVLASNTKGYVAGDIYKQYLTNEEATFSEDLSVLTTLPDTALVLTMGTAEGGRTFANPDGQILGATALKKLAWDSGVTTWNITVEDGKATISSTNSTYGRFLYNASSPRFTTYTSNVSISMLMPQLYILSGGSTVYFTTDISADEPTVDPAITMGHTLNLASDISVNYAIHTSLLADYDTYVLECVLPVYEGNTLVGSKTVTIDPVLKGTYYYFTLNGVTAVNMNDTVTATLRMTKGQEIYLSNPDTYSVAQYAYSQLSKIGNSEELKKLCVDLLRYGSAAQNYQGYRTDALADSYMTEEDSAYLSNLDAVTFGNTNTVLTDLADPALVWTGKALELNSKVTLKFVFALGSYTGAVEDLALLVSYTDRLGQTRQLRL
ncbi:MAG: endonuclease, partial [Oscillospiraceae bacterium]|nr:endonuclease [Oscillospiraceae bacterium]